jgi:hypothetical protein
MSLKKLLGIGQDHKTKPVLMEDVKPAPQDPQSERRVQDAVGQLVTSLIDLERRSYLVRKQLSNMSLHVVAQNKKGKE